MRYRSPPRPPPGRSTAVSATPAHMAAAAGPAELAGADLEMGRVGWLFGCRRCAAVDELRTGCEQRYATKRCLQLHYLANASSTGPRSGTLRCGPTSERGPAWSSKNQAVLQLPAVWLGLRSQRQRDAVQRALCRVYWLPRLLLPPSGNPRHT